MAALSHAVLLWWAVLVTVPIVWTFLASVKSEREIFGDAWSLPASVRLDNWARAWQQAHVGRYMLNSVVVVACGTAGTMLLGAMAAYVLARYRFRGSRVVHALFVAGLALPVYLVLTPLFFVVRNTGALPLVGPFIGLNTHGGLVLVYVAFSLPFTVFFLTAFFRTLPETVAEAAFVDGASHTRVFFQIMLPMARPGVVSVTIFNVLGQWNQYQLPLVLLPSDRDRWVLTQGIADISTTAGYDADWGALFAALGMAILPMIVVHALLQGQIRRGLTAGAFK
ncbi:carbohydrate ABC transporter permease [Streptosporangium saharense]|uniref:N-acetylglucosamine transport system permease protein n=1 Tax=Streptosporangium saharense TaxID=1706840 RepID=A0A7W7QQX2_9ACTN|nr:carbohydrate ABC transporter permease [Streptosporangium saharense]MBB4918142.1 N-acetylglucosamine transport system permease protein [Streptosporangium saharense]